VFHASKVRFRGPAALKGAGLSRCESGSAQNPAFRPNFPSHIHALTCPIEINRDCP